jgi:hypothetical protein
MFYVTHCDFIGDWASGGGGEESWHGKQSNLALQWEWGEGGGRRLSPLVH